MVEILSEWDHRWNENNLDSKLHTLKEETFDTKNSLISTQNDMATISGNITNVQSSINDIHTEFNARNNVLSTEICLLQLYVIGKITAEEMTSLLKMLNSPDKENHVVAHETIDNLIKEAFK